MNRSRITIIIVVALAIVAAIVSAQILSKRTITIHLDDTDYSVSVFAGSSANEQRITTIEADETLSLGDGYYCLVVQGEKYAASEQCFVVYKADKTIDVLPTYSSDYLGSLLTESEMAAIQDTVTQSHAGVIGNYGFTAGKLLGKGEWYVGSLTEKTASASEQADKYRFIAYKDTTGWAIKAKPLLVISAADYPDIPKYVIDSANDL